MQLIRRNRNTTPDLGGLERLQRELSDFFDWTTSAYPTPFRTFGLLEGAWSPALDLYEDKDSLRVVVELPGLKKDEFEATVHGDTLVIQGERKSESEQKKENFYRVERIYGQFHRAVTLPTPVDASKVKASYKDGVLEVILPKKEETKPKQIPVTIQSE